MRNRIIRLCYRKIIDNASPKAWDKLVWESSYNEFLMQSQFYNQEKSYTSFAELLINKPGAERLHYLVSAAVVPYVLQLNGKVPDILNSLGKHFLVFKNHRFEIINSDIKNKAAHRVAINFISEPLQWHDTIGDNMLLSAVGAKETDDGVLTDILQLQPFLSIYSVKEEVE